jgi:peptide/nickel transport system permease protein
LLRRLFGALALVAISVSLGFFVLHVIPGDPLGMVTGQAGRNADALAQLRIQYGLDQSITTQYTHFMSRALTGNFGTSLTDGEPVLPALLSAVNNSLILGVTGLVLAVLLGSAVGSLQGWKPRSIFGRLMGSALTVCYAAPEFMVAIALIALLAYRWALFPVGGLMDPVVGMVGTRLEQLRDELWHLVLPALTLAIGWGAAVARQQRSALRDIAREHHVRSARAKGVTERQVFRQHAFRPSLPSVIVIVGLMIPELLGGAVVVETLFSWPGVGSLLLKSIAARDYPMVSAAIVVVGIMVSLGSLLTDVLIATIDPRVHFEAN